MRKICRLIACACLRPVALVCLCLAGAPGFAETVVLAPGRDATLIESQTGALANGSGPALFAGRTSQAAGSIRRAVIFFDVQEVIPAGSVVTGARLVLSMSQTNAGPVPVALHRLLADWGEGASVAPGGSGAPAAPGDATWIHAFYDAVLWAAPGGDFDPRPDAGALVDQAGPYAWGPTPEMTADVQRWVDGAAANHGWIVIGDESVPGTVKRFEAREAADPALRPALAVDYVPPCRPRFAGPGFWRRQCATGDVGEDTAACADRWLADLGITGTACALVRPATPLDCRDRVLAQMATLVLNLCSGRLQSSCPAAPRGGACAAADVPGRLRALADLLDAGDCLRAASCAAPHE